MALNQYAYYNIGTGLIENVIWLDDEHLDTLVDFPPEGFAIAGIPDGGLAGTWSMCGIGWSYVAGQFVEPPNPEPDVVALAQP